MRRFDPTEYVLSIFPSYASGKREWHSVDIAGLGRLGRVDIRMRVYPDHSNLLTLMALPDSLC